MEETIESLITVATFWAASLLYLYWLRILSERREINLEAARLISFIAMIYISVTDGIGFGFLYLLAFLATGGYIEG